jgi:aminoglycoside 6-adenylyltransferase
MNQTAAAYEQIIEKYVRWAKTDPGTRAAIVIGSRARTDHPADEWSDLDIIVITSDPQRYLATTDWLEDVGNPWLTFVEQTPGGGPERRVMFGGGLDVDFALIPAEQGQQIVSAGIPPDLADIIRRGVRVVVDKDGLAAQLLQMPFDIPLPPPPTQAEFLEVVNDFWYHTVWTAKHLRRGELWWAKSCCDDHEKFRLRRMMEWHARATKGPSYDTWMRGRFLEEWADPRAVQELKRTFAHYDAEDIWRALLATMDLFRWVAIETAERLGYPYLKLGDERATELVKALHSTRLPDQTIEN